MHCPSHTIFILLLRMMYIDISLFNADQYYIDECHNATCSPTSHMIHDIIIICSVILVGVRVVRVINMYNKTYIVITTLYIDTNCSG